MNLNLNSLMLPVISEVLYLIRYTVVHVMCDSTSWRL